MFVLLGAGLGASMGGVVTFVVGTVAGFFDKIDLLPDGLVDPLLALHTTVRMQDGWPTQTIDASATIPTATLSIFRVLLHRQIGFAKALQKDLERFSTDPKGFVATPMPYKIDEPQAEDQSAV